MGKLTGLGGGLPRLSRALPFADEGQAATSRARDARLEWRAWYKTARWQKLRAQVLVEAAFTCCRCGAARASALMVADHKIAHRGNAALFWDRANLQAMCKACHDSQKQREERAEGRGVGKSPQHPRL